MIHHHKETNRLRLTFQYHPDLVAFVKTIPGRQWHTDGKFWSFPYTEKNLELLKTKFFCHPPKIFTCFCCDFIDFHLFASLQF